MREIPRTCSLSYFYYMMPGSKGLSPHELAHRWVKDLSLIHIYTYDNIKIRTEEADCMYSGIMIDTNNFMTKTGVRTFEAAAFLRRNGADVTRVDVYKRQWWMSISPPSQSARICFASANPS